MNQTSDTNTPESRIANSPIIVTGGAGFIGSHIVDYLADPECNNTILIVDNLSTGNLSNIAHHFNPEDLQKVKQNLSKKPSKTTPLHPIHIFQDDTQEVYPSTKKKVTLLTADIRSSHLLEVIFKKSKPAYVFHLAAMISVPQSIQHPILAHSINVDGTFNLLHAAKQAKSVRSFVFSSSCAVYGDPPPSALPLVEQTPLQPLSPYATSKMVGEQYCDLFTKAYDMNCSTLRYFNVYGPRQDPQSPYAAVIPLFMNNASQKKPLTIYGDGLQTRDFIYVSDVVRANIFAATFHSASTEKKGQHIFNLGTGTKTPIIQLAQSILQLYHQDEKTLIFKPKRMGDIIDSYADISLLKTNGFDIKYDIQRGLQKLSASQT